MDISSEDSSADIPEEFKNIVLTSAQFYRVCSPLEQLSGTDPLRRHIILVTSLGHLIELQEGEVLRFTKPNWKDVEKVVVHHEFHPSQLFVVLRKHNHSVCLLSYNNLEILHEWADVSDISSVDADDVGAPSLQLTDTSGKTRTISSLELSSLSPSSGEKQESVERGKQDAACALAHRLKGGIKHAAQLSSQRRTKEAFIMRRLSIMQSQLQGLGVSDDDTLMPALTVKDSDEELTSQWSPPESSQKSVSLKIASVRHKIIHDKWVIGLNVVNMSERLLVCNIQLMLHVSKGTNSLSYTTKILKVVQRRSPFSSTESFSEQPSPETKVTIEKLDPPILRPKKKACVLGICTIPDFSEDSTVVCSGLVTYTCKTLNPEQTQSGVPTKSPSHQFQLSFEPIELNSQELHSHHVAIEKNIAQAGVPFKSVALVGGSVHNSVTFISLVSPLTDIISRLMSRHEMTKVGGVSDMYCFYPENCHPLRFAALTIHPVDSNKVKLCLYTRDDSQAVLLMHTLLAALPSDVSIQPMSMHGHKVNSQDENIRQQLLAKMKEVATYVVDGYEEAVTSKKGDADQAKGKEGGGSKSKSLKTGVPFSKDDQAFDSDVYNREREIISARKEDVTFDAHSYSSWRKKLHKFQSEMDELYVKYLKFKV